MHKYLVKFLFLFFLSAILSKHPLFSKTAIVLAPDTLIIETTKQKGLGPFSKKIRPFYNRTTDISDPWYNCMPQMAGIPDTLSDMYFNTINLNLLQEVYQNYHVGNITNEWFNQLLNWWQIDTTKLTTDMLKVQVGVVIGKDRDNNTVLIVDQNNNHDFNDDQRRILSPPQDSKQFWKNGIHDSSLIQVEYEYYDGKGTQKSTTWLFIDHFPYDDPSRKQAWFKKNPIEYIYTPAEYSLGSFRMWDREYKIAVKPQHATYMMNPTLLLLSTDGEIIIKDPITINDYIKIENTNYVFAEASVDGRYITLVKDNIFVRKKPIIKSLDTQVGTDAPNFSSTTIDNQYIELTAFNGHYVYLDFWGTWCSPCRQEIPSLKNVYAKYKDKGFVIIGIANDKLDSLKNYVEQERITWPQILQEEDKSILKKYNIFGYPTTYLIDPQGKIIEKNIRGEQLEERLEEFFNKN